MPDSGPTEAFLKQIEKRLHRIKGGLAFQIGKVSDIWQIEVSADGIRDRIPTVRKIVDAAPPIPGWKVVAFRQPTEAGLSIQMGEQTIDESSIWYRASDGPQSLNLEIFIAGVTDANFETMTHIAFLFLDSMVGEYAVMTRFASIEFFPLPPDPVRDGLRPLAELPAQVQALR